MSKIVIFDREAFKDKLIELTQEEAKTRKLKSLGSALGVDFNHCLYLGMKYCKEFEERVKYYSINRNPDVSEFRAKSTDLTFPIQNPNMQVNFYSGEI